MICFLFLEELDITAVITRLNPSSVRPNNPVRTFCSDSLSSGKPGPGEARFHKLQEEGKRSSLVIVEEEDK